ncbi:MAG: IPT/TIG domain-containing protein, partial [Myxococcaceae bacterium]|nr:IPT/TIG domain-containing protein [Myxococcaceae bacterium]
MPPPPLRRLLLLLLGLLAACHGSSQVTTATGPWPTDGGPDVPRLDSLQPDSVEAGVGAVTLTLRGGGFTQDSEVQFDEATVAATFVGADALQVELAAAITSMGATHQVRVLVPGTGTTPERAFTVAWPSPRLTSLSPSEVATEGAAFTLHLHGTGFADVSAVRLDGVPLATRFVDSTHLTAQVPTLSTPASLPVLVETSTPGGGRSESLTMRAVVTSLPTVTGLAPEIAPAESPFDLTVTGSGYVCTGSKAQVLLDTSALAPSICEPTRLVVNAPPTPAGSDPVRVRNPSGTESNALTLTVAAANPRPVLSGLSPASAATGGTAFTLGATGTNFVPGATLRFDGRQRATTFVSSTQLEATVLASDI